MFYKEVSGESNWHEINHGSMWTVSREHLFGCSQIFTVYDEIVCPLVRSPQLYHLALETQSSEVMKRKSN